MPNSLGFRCLFAGGMDDKVNDVMEERLSPASWLNMRYRRNERIDYSF